MGLSFFRRMLKTLLVVSVLVAICFGQLGQVCRSSQCKDLEGVYIVTRLWELQSGATFSEQDVVDEFERGFAPIVTELPGFIEYIGTPLQKEGMIFFFNIFQTQAQAEEAQKEAADFVNNGVLANQIQMSQFADGEIDFNFAERCVSNEGFYLSIRFWQFQSGATFSQSDVTREFEEGFGPEIRAQPGFVEYTGVSLSNNQMFFYNVFTTKSGAANANTLAAEFVSDGDLSTQIERVYFDEGLIEFDYYCSTDSNYNSRTSSNSPSSDSVMIGASIISMVAMLLL